MTVLFLLDATLYNSPGLILVSLGLLVSIRFGGFPDLTADGSFTISAAIAALCLASGFPLVVAAVLAAATGAATGAATSLLNLTLKIGRIISAVAVMLIAILATPYLVGGGTIGLLGREDGFGLQAFDQAATALIAAGAPFALHPGTALAAAAVVAIIVVALYRGFRSGPGIRVRYTGSAENSTFLDSRTRAGCQTVALMAGNALIGLGGCYEAVRSGGFNQNMGFGVLLVGLSILILGESIWKSWLRRDFLSVGEAVLAVVAAGYIYAFAVQIVLLFDLVPVDVRLATVLLLLVLLGYASRHHPNTAKFF